MGFWGNRDSREQAIPWWGDAFFALADSIP